MSTHTRAVTAQKQAGARTLLGLCQHTSKTVSVNSVAPESPLFGLVHAGDLLVSIGGVPATSARDAAQQLIDTDFLHLRVHSPHDTDIVFLPGLLQLELGKDKKTGLVKVLSAYTRGASSTADIEAGGESIRAGDLLLAVSSRDGVMATVDTPKAASQRLREAQAGGEFAEALVVRDSTAVVARDIAADAPATRCVARAPWHQALTSERRSPTGSGRTSPTNSLAEDSSADPSEQEASDAPYDHRHRRHSRESPTRRAYANGEAEHHMSRGMMNVAI